ncbi:unnamed protein product [Cuscuta europaea]|uniref:Transposase (putative) gypsy type domain-containing protein n=1 Tax=Cuscuta europaea TaxID=41803 RepID=A0A9P1ECV8_CUSEU|nr:unnamed protein product [Cuscuta europaea]
MSSQSDSQNISRELSAEEESISDVESTSEQPSVGDDAAVAMEVQNTLQMELQAEEFEQVCEDEEVALAFQVAEDEARKEMMKFTVAIPPPRNDAAAGSSRPLDPTPISVAPGKKKKMRAVPRKKQVAVDAGQPIGIPKGYFYLNTAALDVKTRATRGDYMATQLLVGPSAQVVETGPYDVLLHAPASCFAVHILSMELGLRFPLHPFVTEYLRFVKLAPCQLTPNNHSYLAGFLSFCRSRVVEPTLDQFFLSFNLCRGGHSNVGGFANLQQLPEFRLFDDVPSSHKEWKDKFCYVRMAENPFPAPLRDSFRRHVKVGSAALEKKGRKLSKKPEGSEKHTKIRDATLPDELYDMGFRRYRLMGESDERYPPVDRVYQSAGGPDMDARNLSKLKKQLAKENKKKDAPVQQMAVDDIFPRVGTADGAKETVPEVKAAADDNVGSTAEGSPVEELKRKRAGKAAVPSEGKKQKKGGLGIKEAPVVIVEEHSSSEPPVQAPGMAWPQDNVQFSITKGTTIMHATLNPREFLRGATPPTDKFVLSRQADDALCSKVL